MAKYWENAVQFISTTIMGVVIILTALSMTCLMIAERMDVSGWHITLVAILMGAGAYLLGAKGLLSELTSFFSTVNSIFSFLSSTKKPK